jgi:uncharacterized membrane protein YhaH (DUF805 family)
MKDLDWFIDPIKNHYFDFEGRVTRKAYWMFSLFSILVMVALSAFSSTVGTAVAVALALPSLGLAARRLHDVGKSGWWQLVSFIPFIGLVVIIYLLVKQGETGPNKYGNDPRATL